MSALSEESSSRGRSHSNSSTAQSDASRANNPSYIKNSVGRPKVNLRPPFAINDPFDQEEHFSSTKASNSPPTASTSSRPLSPESTAPDRQDDGAAEDTAGFGNLQLPPQGPEGLKAAHHIHPTGTLRGKPDIQPEATEGLGWWTFTLPQKAIKKLEDYMGGQSDEIESDDSSGSRDVERGRSEKQEGEQGKPTKKTMGPEDEKWSMRVKQTSQDYSRNQAETPGWNQPWAPFRRQNSDPWDRQMVSEGPGDQTKAGFGEGRKDRYLQRIQRFLLYSVFAPFWLRLVNIVLTTVSLALACRIHIDERNSNVPGILGVSTTYTMVIACLSILHIFWSTWFEYFGKPIGVWTIRTKMIHTLSDLLFIGAWSSDLSLAFDDYFTTSADCSSWTPTREYTAPPADFGLTAGGDFLGDLCAKQSALVSMIFLSMVLYQAVLVISLFRIFKKVSRSSA